MHRIAPAFWLIVLLASGVPIATDVFGNSEHAKNSGSKDTQGVGVLLMDDFVAINFPLGGFTGQLYNRYLLMTVEGHWVWGISKFFVDLTAAVGLQWYPFGKIFSVYGAGHYGTFFFNNTTVMAEAGINIDIPLGKNIDLVIRGGYFNRKVSRGIEFIRPDQWYLSSKGIAIRLGISVPSFDHHYRFQNLYGEAGGLYREGKYIQAIAKYEQVLEEYERVLKRNKGVSSYSKIIDEDFPTLVKYRIAVCYTNWAEQGDIYSQAEDIIKEIYPTATVREHQEGITYLWGYILFKQKRYEEARPKFQELIDNFPQSIFVENAWYALGKLYFEQGDYEAARQALQQLLDNFPDSEYKEDAQLLLEQARPKK